MEKGYIQVYTGNGKGKTTAALGLAVRAAGAGLRVFIGQFTKKGEYSEISILENLSPAITFRQYGSGHFIGNRVSEEDIRLARQGLEEIRTVVADGEYDIVILDEGNVAVHFGLFSVDDLILVLDEKPGGLEIVITGRWADARIIERADLVTDMRQVKHYYQQSVANREGIES